MPSQLMERKRSDGSKCYQVRIQVGKKPDGKPNYIIQTFEKKSDAVKFKTKILRERDQGLAIVPEKISVNAYLDRWLLVAKKERVAQRQSLVCANDNCTCAWKRSWM